MQAWRGAREAEARDSPDQHRIRFRKKNLRVLGKKKSHNKMDRGDSNPEIAGVLTSPMGGGATGFGAR